MPNPIPDVGGDDALAFADDAVGESGGALSLSPWDSFDGGSGDNGDDSEDPMGKGKAPKHPAHVFMYRPLRESLPKRTVRGGNATPQAQVRLTPGASTVDVNRSRGSKKK